VPTGNRATSTNTDFIVGVGKRKLQCHLLPSVYRSRTFSVRYADRIFTISECCRDSFGEIVCLAAVTLVCIRCALERLVAAYRRFSSPQSRGKFFRGLPEMINKTVKILENLSFWLYIILPNVAV
jgi:hypothetical protein